MSDVVVTIPLNFRYAGRRGLDAWIAEGDAAGETWSGQHWAYSVSGRPDISPGDRVYVVHNGKLRGYAPLVAIKQTGPGRFELVRGGGAVAVTIEERIAGFRGFRYRWWDRAVETPFPDWRKS